MKMKQQYFKFRFFATTFSFSRHLMRSPVILALLLFVSCNQRSGVPIVKEKPTKNIELYVPDKPIDSRAERDLYSYGYKQKLSDLLSLSPLENGTDSFELRFWKVGSLFDPIILYILKKSPYKNWSNLHFQLYRGDSWNREEPEIDSLVVEKVWPRTISWEEYIGGLNLDSLWTTPSQREVVDETFGGVDGHSYFIELASASKYRFLSYYVPERLHNVEPNHRRVINFQKNLREGIVYNGIINP
jgi:hypothetical protein